MTCLAPSTAGVSTRTPYVSRFLLDAAGDDWPEPVRVLAVRAHASAVVLEAVGIQTNRFYSSTLPQSDLA